MLEGCVFDLVPPCSGSRSAPRIIAKYPDRIPVICQGLGEEDVHVVNILVLPCYTQCVLHGLVVYSVCLVGFVFSIVFSILDLKCLVPSGKPPGSPGKQNLGLGTAMELMHKLCYGSLQLRPRRSGTLFNPAWHGAKEVPGARHHAMLRAPCYWSSRSLWIARQISLLSYGPVLSHLCWKHVETSTCKAFKMR